MKQKLIRLIIGAMALFIISSCKKDLVQITAQTGTAATLKASASSVALSVEAAGSQAVEFSWDKADYNYNAAIKYALQIDKKGNNFAAPKEYGIDASMLSQALTVGDLNNALVLLGFTPNVAADMEVRVKSQLATNQNILYSNVLTFTVTPYPVIVIYPSLYVPAAYQGWTVSTAERVSSVLDDGSYEGYVYFGDAANLIFKYTTDANWTTTYGWASSTSTDIWAGGTMSSTASGNLFVPATGYYLLTANTKTNGWSATKTTFGIVGDAVAGGWEGDTEMTYNPESKEWSATTSLTGGKVIKFRANHLWVINYGNNDTPNGFLKLNGANITVPTSGNYTVVLNVSNPGNYTYTLTKN